MKKILLLLIVNIQIYLPQTTITDITSSNLIGDANNNGSYGGHGIMFCDVDGDGDPDMYITMNNSAPMADQFFENVDGVFTEKGAERGIDNYDTDGSHGWVWADLDNDGDYDGWNGSYSKNIPYRNKNNTPGYFEDMFNVSGIENINLGTRGVAAFDYDNDGDLDLFGNNFWARSKFEQNEFYRNDGNFYFTRIDNGLTNAKGDQGVCDGDFDNDGDVDLLLCVFEGNKDGRCVELMENKNGQYVKLENSGLALCNTSVDGVTFWDINNDGWLDVLSGYKIFINNKNKTFSELPNVPSGFRFMRGIADIDNDGHWDLLDPLSGKVYLNKGDLTFTTVSYTTGTIGDLRCISFADIDGDGDVDFAIGQKDTYNRLYRNDYSGENRYLKIKLKTADGQIGAYGTKVYIYSTEGDTLIGYREAHSNQGYLSQDDPVLHFGCGMRDFVKLKAVFVDGNNSEFVVETNQTINIPTSFQIKLFLEGTYNNLNLPNALSGNIPINQPYFIEPWNYLGQETTTYDHIAQNNIADWVLVELRDSVSQNYSNVINYKKAALLRRDGTVIDSNRSNNLTFFGIPPGKYYIIVYHRNHISIMSSVPINFGK